MIAFFKNEQPVQYIFLFFLAILLRLHLFFTPEELPHILYESFFFNMFISSTSFIWKQPILYVLFSSLIITHQGYLLNRLNNKADFWSKGSALPALFYVVFCSALIVFTDTVHPLLFGNYFFILFVFYFFELFEQYSAEHTYYLGLWTGLASAFYFPLFSFFMCGYFFFMFYSNPPVKAYIIYLSGFFTSLFLLFTGFYVSGYTPVFFQDLFYLYLSAVWSPATISTEHLFIIVFVILLFLGGLFNVYMNMNRMNVSVRTSWGILMLVLFTGLFTFFIFTSGNVVYLYFMSVVFCFFVSRLFFQFKKNLTGEVLFFFLLLMILNFQYSLLIF